MHYSFWNPVSILAGFTYFLCIVFGLKLPYIEHIFTTMIVPVSTGKFPRSQVLQWNQFCFVQNFVWKKYPLLLVASTSNFAWSLFWRNFSSRVIYFCQIFFASKIFLKLLLLWSGLDVFPFKMMKKEACHRVQHVKISRNWSSRFVGRLCACLKNQTFERQRKMCSTGLNACNLGYGGQRIRIGHRCHGKHGEHQKNCTSGTVIE